MRMQVESDSLIRPILNIELVFCPLARARAFQVQPKPIVSLLVNARKHVDTGMRKPIRCQHSSTVCQKQSGEEGVGRERDMDVLRRKPATGNSAQLGRNTSGRPRRPFAFPKMLTMGPNVKVRRIALWERE